MSYSKSLNRPPDNFTDLNKWGDYIEILCLTSLDKIISKDEIYDKLYGDKSDDENSVQSNESESEDGLYDITEYTVESSSERTDIRMSKIGDIFEFLKSRQSLYDQHYPFKISQSPQFITLKKESSFRQYSYLGLLISANLDYFSNYKHQLTTTFEVNSVYVFKKLFPTAANVEYFGKGAARSQIFSQNKLIDRLKQLSIILNIKLSSHFDENEIGHNNTGDGGLDLVGWCDLFDENSGKIVNFGQCACGKDWYHKQFDMNIAKWKNYISPNHPILTTLITPSSFRKYDGSWFNNMKIYDCIIIDRLRFIKSLTKRENSKVAFATMSIVEEIKKINMTTFN